MGSLLSYSAVLNVIIQGGFRQRSSGVACEEAKRENDVIITRLFIFVWRLQPNVQSGDFLEDDYLDTKA